MMKFNSMPLFIMLFILPFADANSANKSDVKSDVKSDNKTPVYGEVKEGKPKKKDDGSEETLKKLLTVKGVEEQYEICKKVFSKELAKIPGCIWDGTGEGENNIPKLSSAIKKEVQQMYAEESTPGNAGRSPGSGPSGPTSEMSGLTNKSKQIGEDYMSDPAVVELSKVLQKKLEEALIGDKAAQKETKSIAVVDHAKFIQLYQTELGKTIINAFTSYCIEADFKKYPDLSIKSAVKNCKDSEDKEMPCPLVILSDKESKKETININIQSLQSGDLSSNTKKNTNADASKWTRCIGSVGNVCYTKLSDFSGAEVSSITDDQFNRSKERACIIMDYVKSARKNLMIVDEQLKNFYPNLDAGVAMDIGNARIVPITEKNSIDTVTTVTSKDIEGSKGDKDNKDSYRSKNEELKKEMDKCLDDSGKIIDAEVCKKFISTDTEIKEKALTEFGIRQYALGDNIEEKLKDKSDVEKYLKEEGYDKSKIDQMISNKDDLEKVKAEIKDRYKSEKEAIIASMSKKISSQTTQNNGKIDTTSTGDGSDQDKLVQIKKELSSRTDDLEKLVHFDNIVSSYLEVGKEKERNVASLYAEINNGADSFKDVNKDILDKASKAGLKPSKSEQSTNLGVDTLNGIFKYSTEK